MTISGNPYGKHSRAWPWNGPWPWIALDLFVLPEKINVFNTAVTESHLDPDVQKMTTPFPWHNGCAYTVFQAFQMTEVCSAACLYGAVHHKRSYNKSIANTNSDFFLWWYCAENDINQFSLIRPKWQIAQVAFLPVSGNNIWATSQAYTKLREISEFRNRNQNPPSSTLSLLISPSLGSSSTANCLASSWSCTSSLSAMSVTTWLPSSSVVS